MLDLNTIRTWSVLVVDDEPDNVEVVAEALTFYGLTVKTAMNGKEGLSILQEFKPDLILLDLSMPTMDGWEMRKRVKINPQTQAIPVVALSAHAMVGDKERALSIGFDGYLTKPVNIATFLTDLCETLQQTMASAKAAGEAKVASGADTPSETGKTDKLSPSGRVIDPVETTGTGVGVATGPKITVSDGQTAKANTPAHLQDKLLGSNGKEADE